MIREAHKKLRIVLLMLVWLGVAALQLAIGSHSVHSGKPIVLNNVAIMTAKFMWCAAWLAIPVVCSRC